MHKKEKKYKNIFLIILLIAIIIHIIFLLITFSYYYSSKQFTLPKKQEAQIILQKPKPKPKPQMPKAPPPPKFSGLAGGMPSKPKPPIAKPEPKKEIQQEQKKPEPEKKIEPKSKPKKTALQKQVPIEKTIQKHEQPKRIEKPQPKPPPPKKKLTLNDISKGFLNYTQNQGTNLVQYTKSKKGVPTDEQMKRERYFCKILSPIEQELKRNISSLTLQTPLPDHVSKLSTHVCFLIEKTGELSQLFIDTPSRAKEFDNFILYSVKQASSSFPPIPGYLKTPKLPIRILYELPVALFRPRPSHSRSHFR